MSNKKWLLMCFLALGTAFLLYITYTPTTRKWEKVVVEKEPGMYSVMEVPKKNPDEEGQHNDPVHNKTGNNPTKDVPSKNPVQKEPELHPDEEGQSRNPVEEEPDMYHVAYPRKYKFILDQPQKCQQQNPFLVVIVPVPPQSVEERNAIRTTWGGEKSFDNKVVLVLFLLGSHSEAGQETLQDQLQNESQQYQDLIQSNFQDSYRNLTIKTMVMMEWLSRNCPQASYAVKVDADVLLNIKNLINMLVSLNTVQNNYMSGLVWFESPVMRDPFNKFYLPYDVYPKEKYPPYPLGMCYIFSMDIPHKLLQESKQIKPIYIEDAYLGMCLERLGIVPSKPPNIDQFVVKPPQQYNRCYYSSLIAIMTDSTNQLITYWTDIHSTSTPC